MMERLLNGLLQRVPIQDLQLPDEIDSTPLLNTLHQIKPHNASYVKSFLSSRLFKDPQVDQDEFYDLFAEVLMSKPLDATDIDVICYNVLGNVVKINETPRLISGGGTTGGRTWEAAMYFSIFLNDEYRSKLEGKRILELGAGTGLVGLSLIKSRVAFKSLIVTDGDSSVLEKLAVNYSANSVNVQDPLNNTRCQPLWWGQDEFPNEVDVIIAADVTYDSSAIPSLVQCIHDGLVNHGAKEAVIAATIRNEDTIKTFEERVTEEHGLKYEVIKKDAKPHELNQTIWYRKSVPEIRVYRVFQ
jgi:predicted nicotinamide N-methyase